jgi:hypothetical protein
VSGAHGVLELVCVRCGQSAALDTPGINIGDLRYHTACAPSCATCGRTLHTSEVGWVVQGDVVSAPYGYAVRPMQLWCPDCVESAPHDEPAALD